MRNQRYADFLKLGEILRQRKIAGVGFEPTTFGL